MNKAEKLLALIGEKKQEDIAKAKELVNHYYKKYKGDSKKARKDILDNVVNSKMSRASNEFVTILWAEFNKRWPS
jgi:hypothetical protein